MAVIERSNVIPGAGGGSPLANAGAPVAGVDDVQTLLFTGTPTGGTFALTAFGLTTGLITFTTVAATLAANIVAALEAIVGTGNVACTSSVTVPAVTFQSGAGKRVVNKLIVASQALTAGSSPFVSVKQTIRFTGTPTGGTFKLTYGGVESGAITYSTTDATLQTNIKNALEALAAIGSGNITVASSSSGTLVAVSATALASGTDFALLSVTSPAFTGGTSEAGTVGHTTNGVAGTGFGAPPGALLNDTTNSILYENGGTALAPSFAKVGTQS